MELNLETYARILARLACRRGVHLQDILAEMHIDTAVFGDAEPALRAELSGAWPNRKGITAMRFATALGAELERLGALGGESPSPKALVDDAPLPPLPADARPREPAVPSFLQAAPPPMPIAPIAASAPIQTPAPAAAAIAPPPMIQAHADAEPASKAPFAGTADMDLSAIVSAVKRGAIPFKPSGGSGPPSGAAPGAEGDLAELPLETYASVTGALARGESREDALAMHGLRADVFDRLAKAWAQRFQREPQLLARFQELARSSAASPRRTE